MKHDRQITISVGNNRRDTSWKQTVLTVTELYNRLSVPVRGTETQAAYMAMKKAQQDDLKDVGGFVGGTLNGQRRKSNNMTGRDIITLDFDNVPGWQTDLVISKVEELGCSYAVYSTRKHTPATPRLRVVIPFDRTVTPDEYEPCARRVAAHIGIGMADPTTFEVCRLMYWPSCSADSEFVFKYKDAPLISADFLLSTYKDWHDFLSWPQVPNAVSYQKLAIQAICDELGITLNQKKTQIVKLSHGFTWLKIRFFLTETGKVVKKIYKRSVTRMRIKLKKLHRKLMAGKVEFPDIFATWQSWKSYAEKFNAYHTVQNMAELYTQLFITNKEGYNGLYQSHAG